MSSPEAQQLESPSVGASPILCDHFFTKLRPFQMEGLKFGIKTQGRCMIADEVSWIYQEMGLSLPLQGLVQ